MYNHYQSETHCCYVTNCQWKQRERAAASTWFMIPAVARKCQLVLRMAGERTEITTCACIKQINHCLHFLLSTQRCSRRYILHCHSSFKENWIKSSPEFRPKYLLKIFCLWVGKRQAVEEKQKKAKLIEAENRKQHNNMQFRISTPFVDLIK